MDSEVEDFKKFQKFPLALDEFNLLVKQYSYITDFQNISDDFKFKPAFEFKVTEIGSSSPWICTDYLL